MLAMAMHGKKTKQGWNPSFGGYGRSVEIFLQGACGGDVELQ